MHIAQPFFCTTVSVCAVFCQYCIVSISTQALANIEVTLCVHRVVYVVLICAHITFVHRLCIALVLH